MFNIFKKLEKIRILVACGTFIIWKNAYYRTKNVISEIKKSTGDFYRILDKIDGRSEDTYPNWCTQ
jgi:hypothetical protein